MRLEVTTEEEDVALMLTLVGLTRAIRRVRGPASFDVFTVPTIKATRKRRPSHPKRRRST